MTADREAGFARAALALILEGSVASELDWKSGPYAWGTADRATTAAHRSTYFSPRIARALYGLGRRHTALHPTPIGSTHATALACEVLQFTQSRGESNALFVVHVELPRDARLALSALHDLSRVSNKAHPLRDLIKDTTGGAAELSATLLRATTMTLLTPSTCSLPPASWATQYEGWTAAERWLWLAASATSFERYPPAPAMLNFLSQESVWLSADWQSLVLRDGVAFIGRRADKGESDPFFNEAERYFRSIYLDALLLGSLQRLSLHQIADNLADLEDPIEHPRRLADIERTSANFRNVYWWQHVTGHGIANDLLRAYQLQHRLPDLLAQVVSELSDYSRQAQTDAAERTNALLGILTILGLPLGTALGLDQALNHHGPGWVFSSGAIALLVSGIVFATAPGRRFLQTFVPSLRPTRSDEN